mmetsp:Transcript_9486/g.29248  ORF Transcript_9486/g.29248 Transcript_9486/m.29248 type:complete len:203 (-) Transcript_9486:157-765(-)
MAPERKRLFAAEFPSRVPQRFPPLCVMVLMIFLFSGVVSASGQTDCPLLDTCQDCVDRHDCVWVVKPIINNRANDSAAICVGGDFTGIEQVRGTHISAATDSIYWTTCHLSLQALYITIGVCVGVLVLAIVALIVWCCWYQKRRQHRTAFDTDEWDDYLDEERQAFLDSAHRREEEALRQDSFASKRRLEMDRRAAHKKPSI